MSDPMEIIRQFFAGEKNAVGDYWCKSMVYDAIQSIARQHREEVAADIHSCHHECQRPMCVLCREKEAAEAALGEARELLREADNWLRDYSITALYRCRVNAFLTRTSKETSNGQ